MSIRTIARTHSRTHASCVHGWMHPSTHAHTCTPYTQQREEHCEIQRQTSVLSPTPPQSRPQRLGRYPIKQQMLTAHTSARPPLERFTSRQHFSLFSLLSLSPSAPTLLSSSQQTMRPNPTRCRGAPPSKSSIASGSDGARAMGPQHLASDPAGPLWPCAQPLCLPPPSN